VRFRDRTTPVKRRRLASFPPLSVARRRAPRPLLTLIRAGIGLASRAIGGVPDRRAVVNYGNWYTDLRATILGLHPGFVEVVPDTVCGTGLHYLTGMRQWEDVHSAAGDLLAHHGAVAFVVDKVMEIVPFPFVHHMPQEPVDGLIAEENEAGGAGFVELGEDFRVSLLTRKFGHGGDCRFGQSKLDDAPEVLAFEGLTLRIVDATVGHTVAEPDIGARESERNEYMAVERASGYPVVEWCRGSQCAGAFGHGDGIDDMLGSDRRLFSGPIDFGFAGDGKRFDQHLAPGVGPACMHGSAVDAEDEGGFRGAVRLRDGVKRLSERKAEVHVHGVKLRTVDGAV
jgi:hypothetical protein